jgi:hypothetical protein
MTVHLFSMIVDSGEWERKQRVAGFGPPISWERLKKYMIISIRSFFIDFL